MTKSRSDLVVAVLLGALSMIFWFQPLAETLTLAYTNERYTHLLLILPVALALIGYPVQRTESGWPRRAQAVVLLLLALLLWASSRWGNLARGTDYRLTVAMVGLVVWWIGCFVLGLGKSAWQVYRFQLLFLLWIVPLPSIVVDEIVRGLQYGSAITAQLLFEIVGTPTTREGSSLFLSGLELDVGAECSSIRSSMMLFVTTTLLAYVFLRTRWRRWLTILLAVPLAIAKNGVRIATIGTLGTRVDPSYLTGRLHREGGIVFLSLALAAVCGIVWILRRSESSANTILVPTSPN
jgi:exosortase